MIIKKLSVLLLFLFAANILKSEEISVMSFASKKGQTDSIKGNILNVIPEFIYNQILEGKITLWDNPKKQIKISPQSLQTIENSSRTKFSESINMFFYEKWNIKRKEVEINIIGLSFTNRDDAGEDVSYGFIDYEEISSLMKKTRMPTGADGYYYLSMDQKLKYKDYVYTILQYKGRVVKSAESKKILEELFSNRKITSSAPPIKNEKLVTYSIEFTNRLDGLEVKNSRLFFSAVEDYLKANEELYFNLGGQKMSSHLRRNIFKVDRIEISEIWNRDKDETEYVPVSVKISVNGDYLEPVKVSEMMSWNMQLGFRNLEDFIKEKKFHYILTKVNDQDIKVYEALKYSKALESANWRNIIRSVEQK